MQEQILRDVAIARPRMRFALLRYFNPVGAHPSGTIGEDPSGIPNNLVPYIAQVAVGKREKLRSSAATTRHARRHRRARLHPRRGPRRRPRRRARRRSADTDEAVHTWNLGTGHGTSVLEMVRAFEKAVGREIPYEIVDRRPGDVADVLRRPVQGQPRARLERREARSTTCAPTRGAGSRRTPGASPADAPPGRGRAPAGLPAARTAGVVGGRGAGVEAARRPGGRHRSGPPARQPQLPATHPPTGARRRLHQALQHHRHGDQRRLPGGDLRLAGVAAGRGAAARARRDGAPDPAEQPSGPLGSVRRRARPGRQRHVRAADLKVSVHADGSYAAGARGFHVIAPPDRAPWTADIHRPSMRLATR